MNEALSTALAIITYGLAAGLLLMMPWLALTDMRRTRFLAVRSSRSTRKQSAKRRPRLVPVRSLSGIISAIGWAIIGLFIPKVKRTADHQRLLFSAGTITIFWVSYVGLLILTGWHDGSAGLFFTSWLTVTLLAGLAITADRQASWQQKRQLLPFLPVFYFFWPIMTLVKLTAKKSS